MTFSCSSGTPSAADIGRVYLRLESDDHDDDYNKDEVKDDDNEVARCRS